MLPAPPAILPLPRCTGEGYQERRRDPHGQAGGCSYPDTTPAILFQSRRRRCGLRPRGTNADRGRVDGRGGASGCDVDHHGHCHRLCDRVGAETLTAMGNPARMLPISCIMKTTDVPQRATTQAVVAWLIGVLSPHGCQRIWGSAAERKGGVQSCRSPPTSGNRGYSVACTSSK
jgi:hypothetical protein